MFEASAVWLPRSVINKCPAIILALKRTANVPGRITLLMDSISTIKGIKSDGVPWGSMWVNMWFMLLIHPISIKVNHKGKDRVKVKTKWLVLVKI